MELSVRLPVMSFSTKMNLKVPGHRATQMIPALDFSIRHRLVPWNILMFRTALSLLVHYY